LLIRFAYTSLVGVVGDGEAVHVGCGAVLNVQVHMHNKGTRLRAPHEIFLSYRWKAVFVLSDIAFISKQQDFHRCSGTRKRKAIEETRGFNKFKEG
jgi:hypothetical protein